MKWTDDGHAGRREGQVQGARVFTQRRKLLNAAVSAIDVQIAVLIMSVSCTMNPSLSLWVILLATSSVEARGGL